ncbi:MAG: hypothetical protein LBU77_02115 [Clostridiales bacterium]|nr:hypothetical protein [Clostridiales bacterium]
MKSVVKAIDHLGAKSLYADQPDELIQSVETMNMALETAAVTSRNILERIQKDTDTVKLGAPVLPNLSVCGEVRVIEYGWLHIRLNALLPHCRFQTPKYLNDTVKRLLDQFSANGRTIPYYENAMLIIDEHCNIKSRSVYDPDNKNWKAVSNALKGRVFPDDNQFSLGIVLVSTPSEKLSCNVFVIDAADAGEFFNMRSGGSLYW